MTHGVLAAAEQATVATTGRGAAGLLDLVISGIGEAENSLAEGLAEFLVFGQQLEAVALNGQRGIQNHVPVANEHRPRDLPLHRCGKAHHARAQVEGSGIAFEGKVSDSHSLPAHAEVAQLLVGGIRVGGGRGLRGPRERREGKQDDPKG